MKINMLTFFIKENFGGHIFRREYFIHVKCSINVFFYTINFNFSKSISPKPLIKIIMCIEKVYICVRKFSCCGFGYFFSYLRNKIKSPIPAMLIQAFLSSK